MAAGAPVDQTGDEGQETQVGDHVHHKETRDQHHLVVIMIRPGNRSCHRVVQDEADLRPTARQGKRVTRRATAVEACRRKRDATRLQLSSFSASIARSTRESIPIDAACARVHSLSSCRRAAEGVG